MQKLLAVLPDGFSWRWLLLFFFIALFIWGVLLAGNLIILDIDAALPLFKGMLIVSAILASVPCVFGYFKAKIVFIVMSLGILAGLLFLLYHYAYTENEAGIVGMSTLFAFYLGALGIGILLQIVWFVMNRRKEG
jgi:hypothetical protein